MKATHLSTSKTETISPCSKAAASVAPHRSGSTQSSHRNGGSMTFSSHSLQMFLTSRVINFGNRILHVCCALQDPRSLTKSLQLPWEDGNERVHFRSIGKSKTTAAGEFTSGRCHRGQDRTSLKGKEEEKTMAHGNNNDLQLSHVSRGALKLAHMIDSWSKANNIDSRSQFFAEDLLRGALDLQESLDMHKMLQEASKQTSRINNKQKQELVGQKYEEISTQELGSKRFTVSNCQNRLHEPRLLADFSSTDCTGEMKQVIKECLYKQNILSSSSSSRSMRNSTSNHFEDEYLERNMAPVKSISSTYQPKKAKSSNLIAKLMGLEEVPSEPVQPIRNEDKKSCANSLRPRFSMEMPRARKMQFPVQNKDQKQNRKDELIGTLRCKGLKRQSKVEEDGLEPPCFGTTEVKQCVHKDDQLPPIVIMKPLHLCYPESKVQKELALDKTWMQDRLPAFEFIQEDNSSHHRAKTLEEKELKHIEKDITESLCDYETPYSLNHKQQRNKAILVQHKNTVEQKPSRLNVKKEKEKGVKATRTPIPHLKTSTAKGKPNKELPTARTNASTQVTIPQNEDLNSPLRHISKAPADSAKDKNKPGVKPVRKSAIIESVTDGKDCKENGTTIKSCNKMNNVLKATGTSHGDDLLEHADQDTKPRSSAGNMSKDPKVFWKAMPGNNHDGKNYRFLEFVQLPACKEVDGEAAGIEDGLKNILLSSQSFVGCAKKFFGVDAIQPMHYQRESTDEVIRNSDAELFLDISEELMAEKYHQQMHVIHPLLQHRSWGRTAYFSMDKLVDEISNEIRKLTNYSKLDSIATSEDSMHIRLERDLMCKDTAINSVWDICWGNRICLEETDQVVEEVGKQILSRLIEEAAMELISIDNVYILPGY